MGFFKKEKNKKQSRLRRTLIVTSALMFMMSFAPAMANNSFVDNMMGVETAYAATTTQSWKQDASTGAWKVYDSATGQYLASQWYQDTDGSWYLLKADTNMAEGLYQDTDGSWYYLNEKHDGTYGRLMTTGVYNGISIITNDVHDGTWGRILNLDTIESLRGAIGSGSGTGAGGGQVQKPEVPENKGNGSGQFTEGGFELPGTENKYQTSHSELGSAPLSPEELQAIKDATFY